MAFSEWSFLDFNLYTVPDAGAQAARMKGGGGRSTLLVYVAEGPDVELLAGFLGNILKAAGWDMAADASALALAQGETVGVASLYQQGALSKVVAFGLTPAQLGLQVEAVPYRPFTLGGVDYLLADDLGVIHAERQAGGKARAGMLWRALKPFLDVGT